MGMKRLPKDEALTRLPVTGSFFRIEDDRFEWDDLKAAENLMKDGLSFQFATTIFDDPTARRLQDERHDYGEDRLKLIGRAWNARALAVIFAERQYRIRFISARLTNRKGRNFYANQ
jgi:uncharacterized DUF497 family protein